MINVGLGSFILALIMVSLIGWFIGLVFYVRYQAKEIELLVRERNNWMDTAQHQGRNIDYYRGLVVQIGETFGIQAKIDDTGGVHQNVLCDLVPELVEDLQSNYANILERIETI